MRLPVLISCLMLLAGCQTAAAPVASIPVQFEVTDRANPDQARAMVYVPGQLVEVDPVFDVEVDLVGNDLGNVRLNRMYVTSYTPACDDAPVPELYRTKVIVYPDAVTGAPALPTRLGYRLPLSTRTLMDLGLCNPQRPQTGTVRIHAELAGPDGAPAAADLVIRVGNGG